jgi:hypothetical protein
MLREAGRWRGKSYHCLNILKSNRREELPKNRKEESINYFLV